MFMIAKIEILIICVIFLVACQENGNTVHVTPERASLPTLVTTTLSIETVVSPTLTPAPTIIATSTFPPSEPSAVPLPTPIPTPELMWPTASLLFLRNKNLQQWMPETGEIKILTENVIPHYVLYQGAMVVFVRELIPDEEYAVVVFHIPTESEVELFETSLTGTVGSFDTTFSISPNGRWLAYVTGESRNSAVLIVREVSIESQQIAVSEPVLTVTPGGGWNWPHDRMMWATENELSWSDDSGIWAADLNLNPIEPIIAIAPSTNTFLFTPIANPDEEPFPVLTEFIPYLWSPDGRYLLAQEYFYEYGELRVIERGTNRLAEVLESAIGPISDDALWLNETTLLHYQAAGTIHIWQIDPNTDPFLALDKSIPAVPMGYVGELWSFGNRLQATNYSSIFDFNLETGELIEVAHDIVWPVYWSPDEQYILWSETEFVDGEILGHVFLDDLRNRRIELDNVLGFNSCCWYWYE